MYYHYFLFCFALRQTIVVFGGRLKSSGIGLENNAIFWKYSSPDKSCQGQTYGRLLDRKHYLCTGLFAWRALLKEQNCLGTAFEVVEVQLVQLHQTFFLKLYHSDIVTILVAWLGAIGLLQTELLRWTNNVGVSKFQTVYKRRTRLWNHPSFVGSYVGASTLAL